MNEEDGRPGARSRQLGPSDATPGVPEQFLRARFASRTPSARPIGFALQITKFRAFFWRGPAEGVCPTAGGGEKHENVPGK
jgi:hypothetical protein